MCTTVFAVTGFTSKSLRAVMPRLLGDTRSGMSQAGYDLARLRLDGLIHRVAGHNRYTLTPDGLSFAVFYGKDHDRLRRPLLTPPKQEDRHHQPTDQHGPSHRTAAMPTPRHTRAAHPTT